MEHTGWGCRAPPPREPPAAQLGAAGCRAEPPVRPTQVPHAPLSSAGSGLCSGGCGWRVPGQPLPGRMSALILHITMETGRYRTGLSSRLKAPVPGLGGSRANGRPGRLSTSPLCWPVSPLTAPPGPSLTMRVRGFGGRFRRPHHLDYKYGMVSSGEAGTEGGDSRGGRGCPAAPSTQDWAPGPAHAPPLCRRAGVPPDPAKAPCHLQRVRPSGQAAPGTRTRSAPIAAQATNTAGGRGPGVACRDSALPSPGGVACAPCHRATLPPKTSGVWSRCCPTTLGTLGSGTHGRGARAERGPRSSRAERRTAPSGREHPEDRAEPSALKHLSSFPEKKKNRRQKPLRRPRIN